MKTINKILIPVISTLALATSVMQAQNGANHTTTIDISTDSEKATDKKVRIHLIEDKDGKTVVIDTVLNNPTDADMKAFNIEIPEPPAIPATPSSPGSSGKKVMKVIVKDEGKGADSTVVIQSLSDADIEKELKEMGVEIKKDGKGSVVIVKDVNVTNDGSGDKKTMKIIVKRVELQDLSSDDKKLMSKNLSGDNKLKVERLDFYPNPNNGKFNLSFDLKEKGNTSINIFNAEGKKVYEENLSDFSGEYNKAIDLSGNPKGIYFLNVMQGKNNLVKKVVID